jgi:protein required for attachment to host cells
MTLWIVTLDGAGARLIARRGNDFVLVEALAHPEGRIHEHDMKSDRPGKTHDRHGHSQHSMGGHEGPHAHELGIFIKRVAARLDHGRQHKEFERLLLAAEPHLLGLLRDALDKNTARMVYGSLSKDLQPFPLHDMWSHLKGHLPPE